MSGDQRRKKLAYLVGPIEGVSDHGRGWREELAAKLLELGIESIDPTRAYVELEGGSDISSRRRIVESAREARDWEKVVSIMDKVWEYNEGAVLECGFLIAYFPGEPKSIGTFREMQKAFDHGRPVYAVYENDSRTINTHLLHMILKYGKIFSSFDELIQFLKKTNSSHF